MASGKDWSEAKKIEVVTTYLALGKAPMVAAVTGVPSQTIRVWKMQPWWKELESDIRADEDSELDSRLSRIIDRSLNTVVDRLEHGDFLLDSRSGTIKRVPVKMRDAQRVSVDLIDKRNLIRGKPTSITQKITTEDIMAKLALEFQKWATIKQENVVAVYDQREEGLQEGEPPLQLAAEDHQTSGRTEQSSQDGGEVLQATDS